MNVSSSNPLVALYSDINDPLGFYALFFLGLFPFSRDISMAAGSKIGINTREIQTQPEDPLHLITSVFLHYLFLVPAEISTQPKTSANKTRDFLIHSSHQR